MLSVQPIEQSLKLMASKLARVDVISVHKIVFSQAHTRIPISHINGITLLINPLDTFNSGFNILGNCIITELKSWLIIMVENDGDELFKGNFGYIVDKGRRLI